MRESTKFKNLAIIEVILPILFIFLLKLLSWPAEIAGAFFTFMGLGVLIFLIKEKSYPSALFWASISYLLMASFLFGGNLSHYGHALEDYSFVGVSAYWVHRMTEIFYLFIVILSIAEFFKLRRNENYSSKL